MHFKNFSTCGRPLHSGTQYTYSMQLHIYLTYISFFFSPIPSKTLSPFSPLQREIPSSGISLSERRNHSPSSQMGGSLCLHRDPPFPEREGSLTTLLPLEENMSFNMLPYQRRRTGDALSVSIPPVPYPTWLTMAGLSYHLSLPTKSQLTLLHAVAHSFQQPYTEYSILLNT